jgi:ribonuclease G
LSNELLIGSAPKGYRIALLQEGRLAEFHYEESGSSFVVGEVYLGVVKKVSPGLNAAFVDIGYEKDAFLHYLDLGPQIRSLNKFTKSIQTQKNASYKLSNFRNETDIDKLGKIDQVLSKGQQVLVQVVKEPISSKGPRLSCEISLPGRYVVLVPFSNAISISKKIVEKEERQRLLKLVQSIKPNNFGVIIRTVAAHKETEELEKDLRTLINNWEEGMKNLRIANPRDKVIGEMGKASALLRDVLNENFDSIMVDSKEVYDEIRSYILSVEPDKENLLKLYQGKVKLFEARNVEKQLKLSFGKTVSLPSGGYLVIEHTEALHVIDVNSGSSANKADNGNQETTALNVNKEAAKEIARQLRLRDLGGIICVDFIDMKNIENRKVVFDIMKDEMANDRAKHTVLPLSKFGLMQITRQRVRPDIAVSTMETCPTCNGTGTISSSLNIGETIEQNLDFIMRKQNENGLTLAVHPYLYSFFTEGIYSRRMQWFVKYKKWINLQKDSSLGILDYHFKNKSGEEIELE